MSKLEQLDKKKRSPHLILWVFLLFLIIVFVWAYFSEIDEVTHATGKIIPASQIKVIQNLEGGIVKKVLVHEGQQVKKGQILMYLSDVQFSSDLSVNKKNRVALQVKIARLKAQLANKPFKPTSEDKKSVPNIVASEQQLYKSRIQELKYLKKRRQLLNKEISMNRPLVKSGAVSPVEVLRLEQSLSEIEGKIQAFRSNALSELNKAIDEYNELQAEAQKLEDRLKRTTIRSPVNGIIKQVHVSTEGGVIKSAMPLIEIVPLEDTLRVEVRLKPSDIGFIHIGQNALVKITAYDYSIYGGLEGKVEHISADTSTDKEGNSYYEVWVRTKKAYLGENKNKLRIIPGMQASVSIITGKKSILTYLLKPVLKAKEKALSER